MGEVNKMLNNNAVPRMRTIREISKETGISYYYIRQLCQNNEIVYKRSGNRYLVNLDKFIDYLNGEAKAT